MFRLGFNAGVLVRGAGCVVFIRFDLWYELAVLSLGDSFACDGCCDLILYVGEECVNGYCNIDQFS